MKTNSKDEVLLHVRLPADLVKQFDHWRIDQRMFRSEALQQILEAWFGGTQDRKQ